MMRDLLWLLLVVVNVHRIHGRLLEASGGFYVGDKTEVGTEWNDPICEPGDYNCMNEPDSRTARVHYPPRCHGGPGEVPGVDCLIGPGLVSRRPDIPPRCHGAPGELPGVNCLIGPGPFSRTTAQDNPDCKPRPGHLPPIKCQDPSSLAAAYVTQTSPPADTKAVSSGMAVAKVFETCKYTWQLPGTDCWPPIGQRPHCDHPHDSGCAPTPPSSISTHVTGIDGEVPVGPPPHKPTPPPCSASAHVASIDGEVPVRPPPTPLPPCPTTAH